MLYVKNVEFYSRLPRGPGHYFEEALPNYTGRNIRNGTSQRSYDDSDGIFVPYLLREVRRFERPKKSNLPRTALYLAPGTSFAFPPRTKTTECFCKLWPSPGI